ncbi:flagellar hook-associated protein FlgK [Methylopila turkensis]|uniref:Flagellar hook-associated protein 1 n=1 Tax=Methylopila turkensis TaxID=1437816 RepID=A0A9W6JPV2_9HYPH|nr:flagellar hook-associated protein FlgK [Methylopila turkensis]GLK79433.1 flagellar hook-associated protein FlgK [Methylopila turkensis]
MSLTTALGAALTGLRASQAGLDVVAGNVANANTPGYVRKTLNAEASVAGGVTTGVRTAEIRREIDLYLQRQLRAESAGAAYASTRADALDQVQALFGTPGGATSLDTLVSRFSSSLDALVTSPQDESARQSVLQNAEILARQLNGASSDVQAQREAADQGLRDGVQSANEALRSIEELTHAIIEGNARGQSTAGLMDQRDMAINDLAALMDIRVDDLSGGDIRISTQSGLALYDGTASSLAYTGGGGTIAPESRYSQIAGQSTLGTVTLTRASGQSTDLLADGALRSGQMKAYADLRDVTLPQAQTQLDELAANLAQALGSTTTAGTAIAGGVDLPTGGALPGDRLTVTYTSGGTTRSLTIVNVTDAVRLPLDDNLTADRNDTVIGVDFSSPTAADDLAAALAAKGVSIDVAASGSGFSFTSGAAGVTVAGGSSRITADALSGDGLALPFFVDGSGGAPYSGSLDDGSQRTGFAARIAVNPALLDDPSALVAYAADTAAGDQARLDFLRNALTSDRAFDPDTELGGASSPFTGSLSEFAQGIISNQASASASAARVADGQALVVSALEDRFSSASGVDVDEEMSRLIQFQTAYSANARVMTAVREMLDQLMQI